ncbi:MAG: cytochrome P450 [Actinoplanes sp.]
MTQHDEPVVRPAPDDRPATRAAVPRLPTQRTCPFDPPEEYQRIRAEAPVSRLRFPSGDLGWLVTGYGPVRTLLADPRVSSRRTRGSHPIRRLPPEAEKLLRTQPGDFITADPPEHSRYRRLLTGQFTLRRMNALAGHIEEIVAEHLAAMAELTPPVDLVRTFALPVPALVMCELLGVPFADRELFSQRAQAMISSEGEVAGLLRAREEMLGYMHDLVRAKRRNPGPDMLSGLIGRSTPEGPLTDEELVNIGNLLLIAGFETTANMLALGTLALVQHPDQFAALRDDPGLAENAVEELLRYLSIPQHGVLRTATEDIEIGGERIGAGEPIVAHVPAANRDPAQFTRPEELDVARPSAAHLAFGHGLHQCLGQQLARVEMRVAFRALVERFPALRLAVPLDQVRMRTDSFIYGVHELPVTW